MFFQSSLITYTRDAKKIVTIRKRIRSNTHSLDGMKVKVKLSQMRSYITYKRQKKYICQVVVERNFAKRNR